MDTADVSRVRPRGSGRADDATLARLRVAADDLRKVDVRLRALETEWDVDRAFETNAAAVSLVGVVLAALLDRRLLVIPLAVGAFLLQQALRGRCPPVSLLRRLGFRTAREIEEERYALKALRGDFAPVERAGADPARRAWEAVRT